MRMAKASTADLEMALELVAAFESLANRWGPVMPTACGAVETEDMDPFDRDDDAQCGRALRSLLDLVNRGSLSRVVMGLIVVLDPRNNCVDPDADTLQQHPERGQLREALTAVLRSEVGRQVLLKLAEGQGVETQEGQAWLAASRLVELEPAAAAVREASVDGAPS